MVCKEKMLSIIIPCYNAGKFLKDCLLSFSSLYDYQEMIEIIFVDDGSTDDTKIIIKENWQPNYLYFLTRNMGAGHARNVGISKASGEWIMFLDADDMLINGFFNNNLINFLNCCKSKKIDVIKTSFCKADIYLNKIIFILEPSIEKTSFPSHPFHSCFYRRSFLIENNINFYEYKLQDIETAFRFKVQYYAKNQIVAPSYSFYIHRENPLSNTHTWIKTNMYAIKTIVYYDLYSNFLNQANEKELRMKMYQLLFNYFYCLKYESISDKKYHDKVKSIYKVFVSPRKIRYSIEALGKKNTIKLLLMRKRYKKSLSEPSTKRSVLVAENIKPNYIKISKLLIEKYSAI